jgi:hypothetical protein
MSEVAVPRGGAASDDLVCVDSRCARSSCNEVQGQPRRCTLVWDDGSVRSE